MYRCYVLKVIFKQIKSKSPIGSAGHMNLKSCTADTLLFKKETHFLKIYINILLKHSKDKTEKGISPSGI